MADPMMVPFLVLAVITAVWAVLLVFFVVYQRRSKRQPHSTDNARRPRVSWQVGRWDTDPRHAYVANMGEDTAYEVSVTARDRVIGTAQSVPPYSTNRLSSSSGHPCYVNLCADDRLKRQILVGAHRGTRNAEVRSVDSDRPGFAVRVSWRSARGEWFTQNVRTD
ncbi:hypothetical protein SKC41_29400 [Mycobacterium sp. 050128]|uniref:hypothetical protein n=1 Tax=unclassified Mycobacterium TaxID=2642494 RepID=UPI002EDAEC43